MRWIRLEVAFDETWLFPLPPAAQLGWIKLLCTAKRDGVRGVLKSIAPAVASRKWNIAVEDVERLYQAATADGALVIEGDEMRVTNWLKYQPLDKTAAQRQAKHRDTKKRSNGRSRKVTPLPPVTDDVTQDNGDVTGGHGRKRRYIDTYTNSDSTSKENPAPNGAALLSFEDCESLREKWEKTGRTCEYPRFRKALKPLFVPVKRYSVEQLSKAIEAFDELARSEGPTKAGMWHLNRFVDHIGTYVEWAEMPPVDPETNQLTQRGRLAFKASA